MKRLLWLLALCLILCACGGDNDTEPADVEPEVESVAQEYSPKGSQENPYRVGETIVIDEMYPVSGLSISGIPFRMELTVVETYTSEEGESLRIKKQIPVASLNISITGDYEGSLELDHIFYRPLLTTNLEKVWPQFFAPDRSRSEIKSLEVGEKNDFLLTVYQENQDDPIRSYPYMIISYCYPDSNTLNDLYIDLTSSQSTKPAEEVPDLSEEEKARYYEAAVAAEEKGYYAVANNIYEDIPGYKDSNVRRMAILNALAPYNGTYYGESQVYENVSVRVCVQDGVVWVSYDEENAPVLSYELFLYAEEDGAPPVMTFSSALTRFFLDNHNASYTQGFTLTQEGEDWIVKAVEGNSDQSWNCDLKKVSDIVPQGLLEE